MATLTTLEKAPVIDGNGNQLGAPNQTLYDVASSAPTILSIEWVDWRAVAVGQAPGVATITATRLSDGAVASVEVTVTEGPFDIDLGTPEPK